MPRRLWIRLSLALGLLVVIALSGAPLARSGPLAGGLRSETPWVAYPSPVTADLYAVDMVSPTDGWAVGADGVMLRYTGAAWIQVTSPVTRTLRDLSLLSPTEGYAVGDGFTSLQWDGAAWTPMGMPASWATSTEIPMSLEMTAVYAIPNWVSIGTGCCPAAGIYRKVEPGKRTWTRTVFDDLEESFTDIWMATPSDGWFVGQTAAHYHGEGAPDEWEATLGADIHAHSVYGVGAHDVWLGTEVAGQSLHHWDGDSWTSRFVDLPTGSDITAIRLTSVTSGWALAAREPEYGLTSRFVRYNGTTWSSAQTVDGAYLTGLDMVSAGEGWAVGRGGVIYHYGGQPPKFVYMPAVRHDHPPTPTPVLFELAYDDGAPEGRYGDNAAGRLAAVRFTLPVGAPRHIQRLRYYIKGEMRPVRLALYDHVWRELYSVDVMPTVTSTGDWFELDVAAADIRLAGDFFVALHWLQNSTQGPYLGWDDHRPWAGRSYYGALPPAPLAEGNLMIRVRYD